jgi:membrane associated rhomboid family serine protease
LGTIPTRRSRSGSRAFLAVYLFVSLPLSSSGITEEDRRDPETRAQLDEIWARYLPAYEDWASRQTRQYKQAELRAMWERGVTQNELFQDRWGYKPGKPTLLSLIFCMFLHAGFWHLFGNMLFLWIYGDNVEFRLGPLAYLVSYLGTGIVATIAFSLFNAKSTVPLVGASGAISGVLGFYLIWFPYNYVRVFLFFFILTIVHVRAVFVLLMYLVIDNLLPFLAAQGSAQGGGVAYVAHLGGFVAGVVAAWLFNQAKGRIEPPRPTPGAVGAAPPRAAQRVQVQTVKDHTASFEHAIEHSRMEDAAHAFAAIAREGGRPPQEKHVFVLANWLYENDFTNDAAAVFRYYLKHFAQGADLDRVNLGLGILLSRRLGQPAAARQYLLAAIDVTSADQLAETAREELRRIEG